MEEDIQNYSQTVMFPRTPSVYNKTRHFKLFTNFHVSWDTLYINWRKESILFWSRIYHLGIFSLELDILLTIGVHSSNTNKNSSKQKTSC